LQRAPARRLFLESRTALLDGLRALARFRRRPMQRAHGRRLRRLRLARLRRLGRLRFRGNGGCCVGGGLRSALLGFAFLLGLALDRLLLLLLHFLLLAGNQLLRLLLLGFARGELGLADEGGGRNLGRLLDDGRRLGLVALDEDTLLAHLDLDRPRLAGGPGGLDLARLLTRERDLLLRLAGRAVLLLQVLEQLRLVLLGQVVALLLAVDTRLGKLLDE